MKQWVQSLSPGQLTVVVLVLCLPAFLIHLGTVAFIGDEAIRTLVAFEMKESGDFIVPTLNGEAYYNKPPLYNWCILLVSAVFGHFGEWPSRITTLIFLGGFAVTVWYFTRKQFGDLIALTLAVMLLTSGRILFWDSMLGLIDIAFSAVIYFNWMILYDLGKKRAWRKLFLWSYLLFAIAFLLKGLPAIVFQAISISAALLLHGALRQKLFTTSHLMGIGVGLIPLAFYYSAYASRVSLKKVFFILFDQSVQRTVPSHGLEDTLLHVLTFPAEQLYHFLPWSLLVILVFHPRFMQWVHGHAFVRFNFWMLVANLPVYWLSAQIFPRYLLMFIPLFNLVGYYVLQQSISTTIRWHSIFRYIYTGHALLATVAVIGMPLFSPVRSLPGWSLIWLGGAAGLLLCLPGIWHDAGRLFLWFGIAMLVVRLVFSLVVLPIRSLDYPENICREDCRRVGTKYRHAPWYLYRETFPHEVARFYTSSYAQQIIRKVETATDPEAYYLVDRQLYPDFPGVLVDSLLLERGQKLGVMRLAPE